MCRLKFKVLLFIILIQNTTTLLATFSQATEYHDLSSLVSEIRKLKRDSEVREVTLTTGGKGYFKPFYSLEGAEKPGKVHKHEIAAYQLDQLLGMNLISTTSAVRIKMNAESELIDGSFQAHSLGETAHEIKKRDKTFKKSENLKFFDYLLGNCDRHYHNFLVHDGKEVAIDNGLAFSSRHCRHNITMYFNGFIDDSYPEAQTLLAKLSKNPPLQVLEKIKSTSNSEFRKALELLSEDEFLEFIDRKNHALLRQAILAGSVVSNLPEILALIPKNLKLMNDPDADATTLLSLAESLGQTDVIKALVNAGAKHHNCPTCSRSPIKRLCPNQLL